MKILISEEQHKFLTEANKVDILVNKIGFNEYDAEQLEKKCGGLSIWMGKKIFDYLVSRQMSQEGAEKAKSIEDTKKYLKSGNAVAIFKDQLSSIMDWFRVGLNGNIKEHENESFISLYQLSKEWHDSLGVGDGDINYNEENEVIRDYREDGIGFIGLIWKQIIHLKNVIEWVIVEELIVITQFIH